jgi:hypothetical protein
MPSNNQKTTTTNTQDSLQSLLESTHNHESFGRSVLAGIFSKAIAQAEKDSTQHDEVVVKAEFRLKPVTPEGCYRVYSDVCQCYVISCGRVLPK